MTEPLDLEPIKARLAERKKLPHTFADFEGVDSDLAAAIAEVERLREALHGGDRRLREMLEQYRPKP